MLRTPEGNAVIESAMQNAMDSLEQGEIEFPAEEIGETNVPQENPVQTPAMDGQNEVPGVITPEQG